MRPLGSFSRVVVVVAAAGVLVAGCDGPGAVDGFVKGMTWQITLAEPPTSRSHDVQAWDLDMEETPDDVIAALKGGGSAVICYFSAGTFEPFREDAAAFPAAVKGNPYEEDAFDDELYLDVNDPAVLDIMKARLDRAQDKGCDAVDPDNVDLDQHDTGFAISADDMAAYNGAIVDEAHARGMAVGLKNNTDVALPALGDRYDFFVNESCVAFDECDAYGAVLADDKPVFHIEYEGEIADICAVSRRLGLSTLKKDLALDDPFEACP